MESSRQNRRKPAAHHAVAVVAVSRANSDLAGPAANHHLLTFGQVLNKAALPNSAPRTHSVFLLSP